MVDQEKFREELERRRQPDYPQIARRNFFKYGIFAGICFWGIVGLSFILHGSPSLWAKGEAIVLLAVLSLLFLLFAVLAYVRWQDLKWIASSS